jgi:C-terminal processing protease CtpA/Prc
LRNSKSTGEIYSLGAPICLFSNNEHLQRVFTKPMVLITDALCYSASDMFAAGFQDLRIGKILGIHGNTGAGGANVWGHNTLYKLWSQNMKDSDPFTPLPQGANITVAVRRTLRTSGYPLEDLGVQPDTLHKMTNDDLLKDNTDLINQAIKEL